MGNPSLLAIKAAAEAMLAESQHNPCGYHKTDLAGICDDLRYISQPGQTFVIGLREHGFELDLVGCHNMLDNRFNQLTHFLQVKIEQASETEFVATAKQITEYAPVTGKIADARSGARALSAYQCSQAFRAHFNAGPQETSLVPAGDFLVLRSGYMGRLKVLDAAEENYLTEDELSELAAIEGRGHDILFFKAVGDSGYYHLPAVSGTPAQVRKMVKAAQNQRDAKIKARKAEHEARMALAA